MKLGKGLPEHKWYGILILCYRMPHFKVSEHFRILPPKIKHSSGGKVNQREEREKMVLILAPKLCQ